jgi:DNA helicase-2/ATP-dependent DNA helicase PcrA
MVADESMLSEEQLAILAHPVSRHARVLAGPGTGKSFTATLLLGRLHGASGPGVRTKMLTFTRAATAEFAAKLEEAGLTDDVDPPSTIHSHALSVLMSMTSHGLPEPLRIPDSWESDRLVRSHICRLLSAAGHTVTPGLVKKLEDEMAAGWEKLDEGLVMLADVEPELRAAYVGTWGQHRQVFGYSLLAELPYRAGTALEDIGEDYPPRVSLLIVDEYQDLNAADIRFVRSLARLDVRVIAIGDDDQSIYGWRFADPAGILRFCDEFTPSHDYSLSVSRRCGRQILQAANELIASAPGRSAKRSLTTGPEAPEGMFAYVRFTNNRTEAAAAAAIAAARVRAGVEPRDILVLVRSQADRWRSELQPAFESVGLQLASVDWVTDAIADPVLRAVIALARLLDDPEDSLAWWALTEGLTPQVGPAFTDYIYDGRLQGERWGKALLRLSQAEFPGLSRATAARVAETIAAVTARLGTLTGDLKAWSEENPDAPWSDWLFAELDDSDWRAALIGDDLGEDAEKLLRLVGPAVPLDAGLRGFLNQLEPVGKDLATEEAGGVRLMSISKSKGLTADTALILGVEEGLIPLGRATDLDEERRLLYVAMTRAQRVCVATCAARRSGQLARSGGGRTQVQRRRSSLLDGLSYGAPIDGAEFVTRINEIEMA